MQHSTRPPFEGMILIDLSVGLDFDNDPAAVRTLYERIKAGYLRDRHRLPPTAQILLDNELQGIEECFCRGDGWLDHVVARMGSFSSQLMLAREMLELIHAARAMSRRRSLPLCCN